MPTYAKCPYCGKIGFHPILKNNKVYLKCKYCKKEEKTYWKPSSLKKTTKR